MAAEPYVSIYEDEAQPLREAIEALDIEPVKTILKKASEDFYGHLLDDVENWLLSNLSDRIDGAARGIAQRYLAEALAGDDEKLRRLLGLWHKYKPMEFTLVDGRHYPDHWELLRALCEKFPDLLRTELLDQREQEIAALRNEVARLNRRIADLQAQL